MNIDEFWRPLWVPFSAAIVEVAGQFLLFGIDRDERVALRLVEQSLAWQQGCEELPAFSALEKEINGRFGLL